MKIDGHDIDISNSDKVFFPDAGLTKGDLIDYYEQVASTMVPHMQHYGVSMQRFPDGIDGDSFYNKDTPDYFPDWIDTVNFPKREGGSFNAPVVKTQAGLVYLANQAVLTPHLYLARTDDLNHPDKMIYDLDPPEDTKDYSTVRAAALAIRDVMQELELDCWVQTTGSKGFHVIIPLDCSADFDAVREFAKDTARLLVRREPDKYTLEQRKSDRKGRVFLDMLRNAYGATAVAPYAVRAREEAPVATPIDWQEIEDGASPRDWTIKNLPRRLAQKEDPWASIRQHSYALTGRREQLHELLEQEKPAEEES
ncbi:non-homologous end-joining DNA ligase [Pseudidiomarina salinarum]|uniref:non-homologous end-joining DNA ligase n=1 Tax=Pseudidiomarina salinarum TaxID=435908 RepID=UPI00068F1A62|nr:non-homologous end-joining DNA ligase [Pseudidiomarina salinarum]